MRVAVAEGNKERYRILAIHSQPIGAAGAAGDTLRSLLKTAKAGSAHVIGVIPREQVITRLVRFPSVDSRELTQMVELYAKAQLPYPREQTVMDFHVLKQQEGFSAVVIIACQRDIVDRQLAVLREAGLTPVLLTLSSWGVLGWYRRLLRARAGRTLPIGAAHEPILVMNVDETRTDLVLLHEGRIFSSRSMAQGAQDWKELAEGAELLMLEVERSRAAIRKELPGVEVRSVLLTGLGELAQWSDPLSQRLGIPVSVIDGQQPFEGWSGPASIPMSPVVIEGVACSGLHELLNLNPTEVRLQALHRRQLKELTLVGVLLVGVLLLGASLLALQASRERRLAARLDRALAEFEPSARQCQDKTRSTLLVSAFLEHRRRLAMNLSDVFRATPADVALEGLTFERARQEIVLRGSAGSTQTVLDFLKQLERLDGIGSVQLKYSTRRSSATGDRTDFELTLIQQEPS